MEDSIVAMTEARKEYLKKYRLANKAKRRAYLQQWREEHREKFNEWSRAWAKNNSKKVTARALRYRTHNKSACNIRAAEWFKANPEYKKKWQQSHKPRLNFLAAKRRSKLLMATPKWLTSIQLTAIQKLYDKAAELKKADGVDRHVDHIYPLQGKTVSGFHVPWNLQILTGKANLKKSNRMPTKEIV